MGEFELLVAQETPQGTQFPAGFLFLITQPDIPEESYPLGSMVLADGLLWRKVTPFLGGTQWEPVTEDLDVTNEQLKPVRSISELAIYYSQFAMYYLKMRP